MKTIVRCSDLSSAVSKVVKAVSTKTTNPVLEGIKLSCKGDNLTLSATDMEIAIEKTIAADTFMEGEVVVPGKLFAEFIKKINEGEEIELSSADANKLKIAYNQADTLMQCLSCEEFPEIKKDYNASSFTLSQKDFKDLILKTSFACSQDFSRPVLRGCLIEVENNRAKCVALDGFRLAIMNKEVKESTDKVKAIVPARALVEITRLMEKEEDLITIFIQDNNLMVEVDNTVFTTRLLEGQFINYKQIIPQNYTTTVKIDSRKFKDSIERASIVARDSKNMVKIDIKEGYVNVTANSEVGNVNENIPIELNGQDLVIAFNSKFLIDCINVIDDENLYMNFNSSIAPCVIKPENGDDYLYMILPIRINI